MVTKDEVEAIVAATVTALLPYLAPVTAAATPSVRPLLLCVMGADGNPVPVSLDAQAGHGLLLSVAVGNDER